MENIPEKLQQSWLFGVTRKTVFLKEPQYSIKNASRRVNCIFRLCNVVLREHNERSTFFFLMKNCFEEFCDGYFWEHLRKLVFRTVSVEWWKRKLVKYSCTKEDYKLFLDPVNSLTQSNILSKYTLENNCCQNSGKTRGKTFW